MEVINGAKIGVLYPEGSSWVLDYYIDVLSCVANGNTIAILKECSNVGCQSQACSNKVNSWNRFSGFFSVELLEMYETLLIPVIYPFSTSSLLLSNLATMQKRGTKIVLVVLDPLVIGELHELFNLADTIRVFDQRDLNRVLLEGVRSESIDLQPYPLLDNVHNDYRAQGQKGLVFDVALGHEFRQVIVSSLYESLEHVFRVCRVPSLSRNLKEGDFDKSFQETISNRGLENRVKLERSTLDYQDFKGCFLDANYCVVPGDSLDAMCERRALMALAISFGLPVVIESQRSPLSEYQGQTYSVEGHSEKIKGASLSKAPVWAKKVAERLTPTLSSMIQIEESDNITDSNAGITPLIVLSESLPRVLFKMRANVFSQSGGDTVLLNRLVDGLKERGFDAVIDLNGNEPIKNYDLVHLFNFALRDSTEGFARECVEAGIPYVATSLYEDWPMFFNQMMATYQCFEHYIKVGQPSGLWEKLERKINEVPPSGNWDNTYTATYAKALLTTGRMETNAILRDYPDATNVRSIPLGCEVSENFDGGKLFIEKFGVKDFVFCVGRLETRKNQLMLLKALEYTDHTLVFAANSFTYQPEYAEACKAFKRKGRTVFLERLTPEELASAYQAAKVHALASWYELPGLVSLEAGRYGTNVVACKNGTIEDYLGSLAFYCNPNSYESIREAVCVAFNSPKNTRLKEVVSAFTWGKTLDEHEKLYRDLLATKATVDLDKEDKVKDARAIFADLDTVFPHIGSSSNPVSNSFASPEQVKIENTENHATEKVLERSIEDVDVLLKAADALVAKEQYQNALSAYIDIERNNPDCSRVHRSLGVAYLQINDLVKAKVSFKKALAIDQMDIKALIGVGAVEWAMGRKLEAYEIYKNAANLDSSNQTAILYLVNSSYELNRLDELEGVLREYLKNDPQNTNIQYCLAGCFFKQNKFALAGGTVERILRIDENHSDALELKEIIASKNAEMSNVRMDEASSTTITENRVEPESDISELKTKLEKMKSNRKFGDMVSEIDSYSGPKGADFSDLLILKSEALGCLGKRDEALALFRVIETQGYKPGKVYCGMGAIRASMNEWKEAEELFIKALDADSTLDMPLCGLGMCAEAANSLEDAWNYFAESSKRNPENIQAITGVIRVGYKLHRLEDVEQVLKEYLELKPVDMYMIYALAGCLYAQGRTDEAVKELRNILIFEPENDKATELLSEIQSGSSFLQSDSSKISGVSS